MRAEPGIIGFGRAYIGLFSEPELLDSLRRAFVRDRADFIVLDSNMRGQRFVAAAAALAIDRGLLKHTDTDGDEQSEVYEFRLTAAGKRHFGVKP